MVGEYFTAFRVDLAECDGVMTGGFEAEVDPADSGEQRQYVHCHSERIRT